MAAPSVVGISGSVTRPSRTSHLVATVLDAIAARTAVTPRFVELAEAAPVLFSALTPDRLEGGAREIVRAVEAADVLVVGTPVYRASYTGALKHLFDLVRYDALAGKPVVLLATGGTHLHGLVTEHQLRPMFGFFNALTVPTTIYAVEADFRDYRLVNPALADRIDRVVTEVVTLLEADTATAFGPAAAARRLPAALSA
jgi:FMN reductase